MGRGATTDEEFDLGVERFSLDTFELPPMLDSFIEELDSDNFSDDEALGAFFQGLAQIKLRRKRPLTG